MPSERKSLLLYDGICALCNYFVNFALARDKDGNIQFASLQSEISKQLLASHNLPEEYIESVVFIENEVAYTQSEAVLVAAKHFRYPWKLLAYLRIIPKPLRDLIYKIIANNRYKTFGTYESCPIPPRDFKDRFL